MSSVVAIKVAGAVVIALSIGAACLAPAPRRPHRDAAGTVGTLGLLAYVAALVAVAEGHGPLAAPLVAGAIEAICLAIWLLRGRDDRDDGRPEHLVGPIDWVAFDRERERWQPRRDRSPSA